MNELVAKVGEFIDERITRDQFETWFYALSYSIESRETGRVVELVHEVEGILAESSSGGWSPADLRRELESARSKYEKPLQELARR